jgi:hypothetical protein
MPLEYSILVVIYNSYGCMQLTWQFLDTMGHPFLKQTHVYNFKNYDGDNMGYETK